MTLNWQDPTFWQPQALDTELRRVGDICHGCRRCFNLCPSFGSLFNALDRPEVDGEAEKLTARDLHTVTDLCYQCKLCFNHCPYTPPHRWNIDVPRLMLRAKAVQVRQRGQSLSDRFLGHVDFIGRLNSWLAPLSNWLLRLPFNRVAMEYVVGIHRKRQLPCYHRRTFARWFRRQERTHIQATPAPSAHAALFYTCSVNFNDPDVGVAATRVLQHNNIRVSCPQQRCCGMPFLDGGDIAAAVTNARRNVTSLAPLVKAGASVVVPGPTCSYVLKRDYPELLGTDDAKLVAEHTFDLCEYLMKRHAEGQLQTRFIKPMGTVAYQLPCHLKAQNIGYKSRDLMALIPGTRVHLVEKCAGVDGTWGLKREYFDLSVKIAEPMVHALQAPVPDHLVSDCSLAALQIAQGTGRATRHPIQILAAAYGLDGAKGS